MSKSPREARVELPVSAAIRRRREKKAKRPRRLYGVSFGGAIAVFETQEQAGWWAAQHAKQKPRMRVFEETYSHEAFT